jgi:PAS domain S-box-containing protein
MGTSGVNRAVEQAASAARPATSPLELVELAVLEVLGEDPAFGALPTILSLLVTTVGCRAAIAFQEDAGRGLVIRAAHPGHAGGDQALQAEIRALSAEHRDVAAAGGHFLAPLTSGSMPGGRPMSVLMSYSAPDSRRCLCAVALVGDSARWNADARAAARAVAAIVAVRILHANDHAELAESHARTAALVERAPYAIVVADADAHLIVFNQAAQELTGWQREEVLGKPMGEVLIGERERSAAMDGGFLRDIGELELAHGALVESETRFRLLAQLAPVGILQTDLDGTCTYANLRWCELAELTEPQALGASWSQKIHPDDVDRLEREWEQAAVTGRELRTDCRLRPGGGGPVWVNFSVVPILAAGQRPCGFLAAVSDVSARKRAEAESERLLEAEREARRSLAHQTERLNSLIAAAIPGILVSDENGRITQINASFCDMFGIKDGREEVTGTHVAEIVLRIKEVFADPSEFVRRTGAAFTARLPAAGQEITAADGRAFECDYWPVLVDGEYRGDLWLAWDISERKALADQRQRLLEAELAAREAAEQAQAVLAEQNARLQELDGAKTQFLATMSHELRTPLTSIISFTELILDDEQELTPDTTSSLSVIQRNAERLLRLLGDLLLLSRLDAGAVPLDLAPVSVPALIGEAIRSGSAVAAERGITVEVRAGAGPPVQADQFRLEQVFDNLLSNAIKFSGQDGRVRVEATHDQGMWRIEVSDDGIGIPAAELGQLFGRFVRASNARTAGVPGTGLGLSVVKAITELHGGRVTVSSAEGLGTTFTVYLPASA